MATKPSTTIEWAELAIYTQGSGSGYPTKLVDPLGGTQGSIPGKGVVAQFYNFNMHYLGKWTEWLAHGTSDPDIDAHIIETDADGTSKIATLQVGGQFDKVSGLNALEVINNSDEFDYAASFTNVSGGYAIFAENDGSQATIYANNESGPAIEGLSDGTGVSDPTDAVGVYGAAPLGIGVNATTGNGYGLFGLAGAPGGIAAKLQSISKGIDVTATGDDGIAIDAYVSNDSANGTAIRAFSSASADAFYGYSEGGNAGIFETSGTYSPVRIVPRQDPANIEFGSIWFNAPYLGYGASPGVRRYVWGTRDGASKGFGLNPTETTVSGSLSNHASMQMSFIPASDGYVEIDVSFVARAITSGSAGRGQIGWLVVDVNESTIIGGGTQYISDISTAQIDHQVHRSFRYQVPGAGTRTFRVDFYRGNPAVNYVVKDCSIKGLGIFNTIGGL